AAGGSPVMVRERRGALEGMAVEGRVRGGIAPTRQQICEHYVEHMLSRRGIATAYPSQHIRGWLAWLARQMKQQNQTVFYLEHMQPGWLAARHTRLLYQLSVGLVIGLVSGLVIGLVFGLVGG